MSNVLEPHKQQEILALGRLGWTLTRIARATGVHRVTVGEYLRAAGLPIRGRGRPGEGPPKPTISGEVSTDSVAQPATTHAVSTDSGLAEASRAPTASACEPYRELIATAVANGRNAMAIWQDLVDDHRFPARYASVRRFVAALRGATPPEARVVIPTLPGQEGQVDYGDGPMVRWAETGKYRRTRLFLLTLAHSRKAARLLTWKSSTQIWCELHERAFRRLGGTPAVIVLDNLKEGVLTPDIYDPALNPLYRDVLAHYGTVALPCRVGDPDRKGKAEERPTLRPLPVEPFRYYRFGDRTVHLDGCVEVDAAFYGAPPGWIGRRVHVQWNDLHVRLIDPKTRQLLREHLRAPRGYHRIEDRDRPTRTPPTTLALLGRAATAGASIGAVCQHIHAQGTAHSVRQLLGVLALAKKHGVAVVVDAAKAALEIGVPTYRFLRKYVDRRPPLPLTLKQVDPLIRQLTLYRDLIDQKTGGSE
jgi:transposase